MTRGQCDYPIAPGVEKLISTNHEPANPLSGKRCKRSIDVGVRGGIQHDSSQSGLARCVLHILRLGHSFRGRIHEHGHQVGFGNEFPQ